MREIDAFKRLSGPYECNPLPTAVPCLGVAATRMSVIRIGAERAQLCFWIRCTDHREGASLVFAVEWSELGGVVRWETAGRSVLWIVEPEPYVKGVGRWQGRVRIKTEDLVEQDRLDANMAVVGVISNLNVRLIPRQAEAALEDVLEVWIGRFVRQERAALYRKEIEGETGFESIKIQNHGVIEFPANNRRPGPGFFIMRFAKALDKLRIWHQIKSDLVFLVLSGGRDRSDKGSYDRSQSEDDKARLKVVPALHELARSHCILHFV
jgi:hypothetical protein